LQVATAMGVGLALAPYNAKYRDVKHFVPLALQLFYYSTPAIYPESVVPPWARFWFDLNPLAIVITGYRSALLGHWPPLDDIVRLFFIALVSLGGGLYLFVKKEGEVIDYL